MNRRAPPRVSGMPARLICCALLIVCSANRGWADSIHHSLWQIHGKHNTVYLLGSIHVLRPADYPLPPAVLRAYADSQALVMEIAMDELESSALQGELLSGASLPNERTLPDVMGEARYAHAQALAKDLGVDLSTYDRFAPWFTAEAISQLQLLQLGFEPESGVEMYFLGRARTDAKRISGLETVRDQVSLFQGLPMNVQTEYLVSSLEQAHALPKQVDDMVAAWQRGDGAWFERELKIEFGREPSLYQAFLAARNRKWVPKIETLLNEDKNVLVIVGTGHLVGRDSVIELLQRDGFGAVQQ